jgi:hypothetical protein
MADMHEPGTDSSLDRFLRNRAPIMLDPGYGRINERIGAGLLVFAVVLFGIGIVLRSFEVAAGAFGPLTGGLVNLKIAAQARAENLDRRGPRLSAEARAFLQSLLRRMLGWRFDLFPLSLKPPLPDGPRSRRLEARRARRGLRAECKGYRSAQSVLPAHVFAMLETASRHHNRIEASLELARTRGLEPVSLPSEAILTAADEAMAGLLHDAALAERYPESTVHTVHANAQMEALEEVAIRLERWVRADSAPSRGAVSPIERVLEDLQLESQARLELSDAALPPLEH